MGISPQAPKSHLPVTGLILHLMSLTFRNLLMKKASELRVY